MGNTNSRDKESDVKKKYIQSKSRRQSNRSIMSTRFSSTSLSSFASSRNLGLDSEQNKVQQQPQQQQQQQQQQQHHNLLDKIKHGKNHKKNLSLCKNSSSQQSSSIRFDNNYNSSFEDLQSPSSTLHYGSPHSVNEVPLIEKYTDSQMTLLYNNSGIQSSQVDNTTNASIFTNNSNSTLNTTTTNNTNYTNTNMSESTEEMKRAYSSELMLKELYMLCETSPERRRDRDRRHRQHYLSKRTWGSNYKIPLENPKLIIDWCCATAVWDIELAFEFPNAQVIGIDYESATVSSLTNTVKNFSFKNAMIHQGKTGLESFRDNTVDFIMMRDVWLVNSPASKWTSILREIYRILKPGGYIEIYEQDTNFKSMGPYLTILEQWSDRFYEAMKLDRDTNNQLATFLHDAGLVNIQHEFKELPIGEWPEDKESKETGYLQKDLTERRFREAKRWYCKFNNLSEKEYTRTLIKAIDECDTYNTSVRSLYFSAQKPSLQ